MAKSNQHTSPLEQIGQLAERFSQGARSRVNRKRESQAAEILSGLGKPDTSRAEASFAELQNAYEPRPEYGYDAVSLWRRATTRSLTLVSLAGMEVPGKQILDVGAGDGMLGVALTAFGHVAALADQEDWRCDRARDVAFHRADCCRQLPFAAAAFDLVCSYNSFEHFPDPAAAFNEMLRVVKPGGWIYIEFNPLYGSPWGLHAYRALRMPYPQFLFSEEFIKQKLVEIGIWDLGKKRTELQFLNRWRPAQFERLWDHPGSTIITKKRSWEKSELDVVISFPEAFRGRNLTLEDITISGLSVTLKKNG